MKTVGLNWKRFVWQSACHISDEVATDCHASSLMKSVGLTSKRFVRQSACHISDEVATDCQQNLAQKICHLQYMYEVADERIWNIDETSCRKRVEFYHLVMLDTERAKGTPAASIGDRRLQATVMSAMPFLPTQPWYVQILFTAKRKATRNLPDTSLQLSGPQRALECY
eukprot:5344938-Amphidinium_carterae.1